jgi:glycosyltransferase involved in cell wall biosynthesis
MKVGIVTPFFFPHIGGMEKSLFNLAKGLTKNGHEVIVYTTKFSTQELYDRLEFRVTTSKNKDLITWSEGINGFIQDYNDFSVLIYGGIGKDVLRGIHSSLKKSSKLGISSILRVPTSDHLQRHLRRVDKRKILELFDHFVCIDQIAVSYLKNDLSLDSVTYIKNGVDTNVYKPTKSFDQRKNTFLYIGRISSRKRIEKVIEIANRLPKSYRFIVQGSKSFGELKYYQEMVAILKNMDNIQLVNEGWDNYKLYQEAGYFVLPSTSEGCPNVILEAMATEVYCFTSNIPENKKLIGNDGTAINFDLDDYFFSIEEVLSTPNRNANNVKSGRKRVLNTLSFSHTLSSWERLLDSF